jgi:hypothetical protein
VLASKERTSTEPDAGVHVRLSWPQRAFGVLAFSFPVPVLWVLLPSGSAKDVAEFLACFLMAQAVLAAKNVCLRLTPTQLEYPPRRGSVRLDWDQVIAVGLQDRRIGPKIVLSTVAGTDVKVPSMCMTRKGARPTRARVEPWWAEHRRTGHVAENEPTGTA